MDKKKFDKKAALSLDMLVIIILAILLIVLLLYLIFNNVILDWFRALPGYEYNKEDKLIEYSDDIEELLNYLKIGIVQNGTKIAFCTDGDCNNLRPSNLYITGSRDIGEIYISEDGFFGLDFLNPDDKIGNVNNGKVSLNSDVFDSKKNNLPSISDLNNLDKSLYISGILYRNEEGRVVDGEDDKVDEIKVDPLASLIMKLDDLLDSSILVSGSEEKIVDSLKISLDPYFEIKNNDGVDLIEKFGIKVLSDDQQQVRTRMQFGGFDGKDWDDFVAANFKFQNGERVGGIVNELNKICKINRNDRYVFQIPHGVIKNGGLIIGGDFDEKDREFYTDPIIKRLDYNGQEIEVKLRFWRECFNE